MDLYLASASPRRLQLVEQLHLCAAVRSADIDETPLAKETPAAYVQRLALAKAEAVYQALVQELGIPPSQPVLGADTAVVLHEQIFGKPADAQQARHMLSQLSGQTHQVLTAVALLCGDAQGQVQHLQALNISTVGFAHLPSQQIEHYIASGEPFGKAGAYAIQGRAAAFISHLQGSYSGVMGLPLYETAQLLHTAGIAFA